MLGLKGRESNGQSVGKNHPEMDFFPGTPWFDCQMGKRMVETPVEVIAMVNANTIQPIQ